MTEGAVIEDRTVALCGFRQCRAPLPPPGPRGGRPFEFCPDRRWPGERTCKQLAAADQALREALGDSAPHAGLADAATEFVRAATELGGPLQTLRNALDSVAARAQDEVTAALTRAETAEARALEADGLRQAAETRAQEAEAATAAAQAHAGEQAALAESAEHTATAAVKARKTAELDQARAEAAATAALTRADQAASDTRAERTRADALSAELAQRTEHLAVRTTERDAALESLAQAHARTTETRDALTAELTRVRETAAADLAQVRDAATAAHTRATDLDARLQSALAEHHRATTAAAEARTEHHRQTADLTARLEEATSRLTREADAHTAVRARLSRVHRLALTDGTDLRPALLAELLDVPGGPTQA
ncbi:response regulator receiver protein [Amycolatopsis rhabdoformis]|uniref:Response regulator receiver protein n=1 Tax=Amycolatopsis rhabdoformis TaxID=1448059 RepID=A0ABZ1IFQ7_9PSEU|nr:response regulator receiver protein [Amycolatopsis rhabdoformis]WSE32998.1 response regulator receiver protein [Amycolatopsis rhabdoformis]